MFRFDNGGSTHHQLNRGTTHNSAFPIQAESRKNPMQLCPPASIARCGPAAVPRTAQLGAICLPLLSLKVFMCQSHIMFGSQSAHLFA